MKTYTLELANNIRSTMNHLGLVIALFSFFLMACEEDPAINEGFEATLNIEAVKSSVQEGTDNTVSLIISLDKENSSGSAITIKYDISGSANSGEDYETLNGSIQIASGNSNAQLTINLIDDSNLEADETIVITLSNSQSEGITVGSSGSATVTISDNDESSFTSSVGLTATDDIALEGDNDGEFTISLDQVNSSGATISIAYSISGTATSGDDYTSLSGTANIPNGSTSAIIMVSVIDDSDVESEETVILTLNASQPSGINLGSNTTATVTISDNDEESSETVSFTVGETTGNSITIDDWTTITGVDGYVIMISDEDSFTDFVDNADPAASTAYVGYGEQVVYKGSTSASFTVTMLSYSTTYYFKAFPYSGASYDNLQSSEAAASVNCSTSSTTENQVCFEVASDTRTISSNQYPSHSTGNFPNADPTAIEVTRVLDLSPSTTGSATYVYDESGPPTPMNQNFYKFGIASNGIEFHPMGLQPWTNPNSGEENWEWQAKVTEEGETDLDAWGAHVTSAGNYHYHGDIVGLASDEDGSRHSLLYGFAADGFPIYYKYGYTLANDPTSAIKELISSYQLKSGSRTGTGTGGQDYPSGSYDGTYIEDFEYVNGLGDLDECNGRTGVTPEFPDGTYYYVITSDFPVTPNCFMGSPDSDWIIGN